MAALESETMPCVGEGVLHPIVIIVVGVIVIFAATTGTAR
jgi:hypothetical protein